MSQQAARETFVDKIPSHQKLMMFRLENISAGLVVIIILIFFAAG
jgi:hypothetical protein